MAKVSYIIRDNPAGDPETSQTVTVKTAAGDTLATPTTDSNGIATYTQDGSPGPMVAQSTTGGGRTIKRDGRSRDQLGTWFPDDAPVIWRTHGNGVIPGYSDPDTAANDMAVSAGTGLQVVVATGALLIDGHLYRCTAATNLTIGANSSGSTRYDRVVIRLTRPGQTTEGACELLVVAGTAGAGDAVALTRTSSTYEVSLAKVRIVNGAGSLTSGDLTDERYAPTLYQAYVPVNPNAFSASTASLTAGDVFYVNAAGKYTRLPKGTDGQVLALASGLPAWATQSLSVTVQEGDVTVDAAVSTLDFDATDFNVTSTPAGEANIALAYGTTAGTPAEGNHTHLLAGITDITASATEVNYTDGVTSAIQTQLDAKFAKAGGSISGTTSITGGLTTSGNTTLGTTGSVTHLFGPLWMGGGVFTVTVGSAAGTGGSVAATRVRGGDNAGEVQIVTGASGVTTGTLVSVNFANALPDTDYIVLLTPTSTNAGDLDVSISTRTTGSFLIRANTAPGTGETLMFAFLVIQTNAA